MEVIIRYLDNLVEIQELGDPFYWLNPLISERIFCDVTCTS